MIMIICTENGNNFMKYEDKIKNRKTTFHMKQSFNTDRILV